MPVFSLMALSIVESLCSGTLAFGKWQQRGRDIYIYSLLLAFSEAVASSSDFTYVLKGREEVYYLSQGAHAVPDRQKVVSHGSSFALYKKIAVQPHPLQLGSLRPRRQVNNPMPKTGVACRWR